MNEEETVLAVTAKLVGKLYIGQRVRYIGPAVDKLYPGVGTVIDMSDFDRRVRVEWTTAGWFTSTEHPTALEPL